MLGSEISAIQKCLQAYADVVLMTSLQSAGRRHTHVLRRRRDGTQGGSTLLCCLLLPPGAAILSTLGLGLATAWHGEGYVAENLKYVSTIEGQR